MLLLKEYTTSLNQQQQRGCPGRRLLLKHLVTSTMDFVMDGVSLAQTYLTGQCETEVLNLSNTGPSSDHTTGNGKYNNTVNDFTISVSYQYTRPTSPVVQKPENAIKGINLYQMVNEISFPKSYPLDRDLPVG